MTPGLKRAVTCLVFCVVLAFVVAGRVLRAGVAAGCGTAKLGSGSVDFPAGIAPRSEVSADFNLDGKLDLAVANFGSGQGSTNGSIVILLNNGLGGFSAPSNITAGINPRSIVAADFNNDTKPDIAVLNYVNGNCCIAGFATILLGDGAGNFAPSGSPVSVGSDPSSLTVGDFNKDGKSDLAAALSTVNVAVLLGDGAGGFSAPSLFAAGGGANKSIVTGDVNGDTKLDLVTGNPNSFNFSVLLGNGLGGFGAPVTYNPSANPQFVALADFNHDNKLDVVTANTTNSVSVLLGDGLGGFGAPNSFSLPSSPRSVVAQDFNGDGHLDLTTVNGGTDSISVLLGNGSGGFGASSSYATGSSPFFAVGRDFTGDGKADLAVANSLSNNISLITGDGNGNFGSARAFGVGLTPLSVAGGDFNGDGKFDLVATNNGQSSVSVLLGDGTGAFGTDTKYPVNASPRDCVVADFNNDGRLDLATANSPATFSILLGTGAGAFSPPVNLNAGSSPWGITSADFNRDGKADLAVVNNGGNSLSVFLGDGNGNFAPSGTLSLAGSPTDVANGDFNGDGNSDLVVTVGNFNSVAILLGNGSGMFSPGVESAVPGAIAVAVGDVNGDGNADLGTANSTGSVSILRGDGLGGFGPPNDLSVPSASALAFGDFNNDGKTDLAAPSGSGNVVVRTGDGAGAFGAAVSFNGGGSPGNILAADLNNDGRLDLAAPHLGSAGSVSILLNSCPDAPVVPPSLSIADVATVEGNTGQTNAVFSVTLSSISDQTVTISYYASAQTADSSVDFQPVSGHLSFAPGVTTQTITVPLIGDTLTESNEILNVFLAHPLNASVTKPKGVGLIIDDDGPTRFVFSAADYRASESTHSVEIAVVRSGDAGAPAAVAYTTSDTAGQNSCGAVTGVASPRCDYLATLGTLRFAAGETAKNISIPIVDDAYAEGSESFSVALTNPSGGILSSPSSATIVIADNETVTGANPVDLSTFFVRQHYTDFLNRQPDQAGLDFWTNEITSCRGNAQCVEVKRINVSASFFLSIEFQQSGYLVERFYKVAYGDASGTSTFQSNHQLTVPVVRLNEFLGDTQRIGQGFVVLQPGWEQLLENNKQAYALEFVQTSRFVAAFPTTMAPAQFVDQLNVNAGNVLSPSERATAINLFAGAANSSNTTARAQAVRQVAEDTDLYNAEYNRAFVLAEYFGYLRRNPNDAPDSDYTGYDFWLTKLNQFNGNYINAEMVKAFLSSIEYRQRFGP